AVTASGRGPAPNPGIGTRSAWSSGSTRRRRLGGHRISGAGLPRDTGLDGDLADSRALGPAPPSVGGNLPAQRIQNTRTTSRWPSPATRRRRRAAVPMRPSSLQTHKLRTLDSARRAAANSYGL